MLALEQRRPEKSFTFQAQGHEIELETTGNDNVGLEFQSHLPLTLLFKVAMRLEMVLGL